MNTIVPRGQRAAEILKDIRLNRLDKRYIQREFAEAIGGNRRNIINVESGRQALTRNLLNEIKKCFNKTTEELLPKDLWHLFDEIESPKSSVNNDILKSKDELIESLRHRILELENDKKMLLEEKGKLMRIVEKLTLAIAN